MRIVCLRALCVSAALLFSSVCAADLPETKVLSRDATELEKDPSRRLRVVEVADENKGDERTFTAQAALDATFELAKKMVKTGMEHVHTMTFMPPGSGDIGESLKNLAISELSPAESAAKTTLQNMLNEASRIGHKPSHAVQLASPTHRLSVVFDTEGTAISKSISELYRK